MFMNDTKRVVCARQFALPLDQTALNNVYNNESAVVLIEQVFQTKAGDITIFLKWEQDEDNSIRRQQVRERQVDEL